MLRPYIFNTTVVTSTGEVNWLPSFGLDVSCDRHCAFLLDKLGLKGKIQLDIKNGLEILSTGITRICIFHNFVLEMMSLKADLLFCDSPMGIIHWP